MSEDAVTDEQPVVTIRLDDLRQVLAAATSNPYLGDDGKSWDYLDRLEAAANAQAGEP